jgi:carbon monoxide dehydrogenase subunit G
MKVEASSTINRPIGEVWNLLADTTTWPKWAPVYLEIRQTSPGPVGVGATFQSKHPSNRKLTEKLAEYEPNWKFAFEFTSGPIIGSKETYAMEEMSYEGRPSTKLTREFDLKYGGVFKLLGPLLVAPSFRREKRVEVDNIKRLLETR